MENKIPSLTLDPMPELKFEEKPKETDVAPSERPEIEKLSAEEQVAVREFSKQIDVMNAEQILNFGSVAQKNIADFSGAALNSVRTKDMGEVGGMLSSLVVELKSIDFDEDEKKGFFSRLFNKSSNRITELKADFDRVEVNIDKITRELEKHELVLMKDIALMDNMYERNLQYYKELTMYILAGKLRCEEVRNTLCVEYENKAKLSGAPEDAQAANDLTNMVGRFEKKLHDLELTRIISVQMAPQIRMIQNNNALMVEKIRSSIVNTIPLWKSQMVLALSLHHSEQAMEAQRSVTNVTNELLKSNAERLHQGSVEIAREAERAIIDLETLRHTNAELIATLEDVRLIQNEGAQRRAEAEVELGRIEGELKQKLLELRG